MRISFPKCWPAVLVLAATPVAARPPADREDVKPVIDRVNDLKAAPADPADSPIRKLQKERFNARLAVAQMQVLAVRAGTASHHDMTNLVVRLAENGADLETRPADRVKWLRLRVDILREQEQLAVERSKAGAASTSTANLATADRADAEIDLLRLQESLQEKK